MSFFIVVDSENHPVYDKLYTASKEGYTARRVAKRYGPKDPAGNSTYRAVEVDLFGTDGVVYGLTKEEIADAAEVTVEPQSPAV